MTERVSPAPGPTSAPPVRPRSGRSRLLLWLLGLVLLGLIAALVAIHQPFIATRLANTGLGRLTLSPGSVTRVDHVRGGLTFLEVRGLRVTRADTVLASVDTLRARYSFSRLITGTIYVRDVDLAGVMVTRDFIGSRPPDTTRAKPRKPVLTWTDLLRGRFYTGRPIQIRKLAIRRAQYGGYSGAPDSGVTLEGIGVRAHDVSLGRTFSFHLDSLEVRGRSARTPNIALGLSASLERGRFEVRSLHMSTDSSAIDGSALVVVDARDSLAELRLALRARPFALGDLQPLVRGSNFAGLVVADIDVHGPRPDRASGRVFISADRARIGSLELRDVRIDGPLSEGASRLKASARYEGARVDVSGWLRPLDARPTYDVEAHLDRLPQRIAGAAWWPAFAARTGAAVTVRAQGAGYSKPVLNLQARADGDLGFVDLDSRLDTSHSLAWSVRKLAFRELNLARITGDTTTILLSGTLSASGYEDGEKPRRMNAELTLSPSTYGGVRVTRGRVVTRMNGSDLGASLRIETDAGALEVDTLVGRWDPKGTIRLRGARFQDVDLGRITGQPTLASRLAGRMSGQLRGLPTLTTRGGAANALRDGRVSGDLRIDLAPSRFRDKEIANGSVRASLARGSVNVDGALASAAGTIDLAARARPFDAAPTYGIDRATFSDVDLATWTGVASLSSRVSGRLTGAGRTGAAERWDATLRLDRSRISKLDLHSAESRLSWAGGRGQFSATLLTEGDTVLARGDVAIRDRVPEGRVDVTVPLAVLTALAGRDSVEASGSIVVRSSFTGLEPGTATVDGMVSGAGSIAQARLDSLYAGFRVRQGMLVLDTLQLRSNVMTATGAGRVALFDTTGVSDLRARLTVFNVTPLSGVVGADTLAADTSTVDFRVQGEAGLKIVEVHGSLRSVAWNNVRLLGASESAQVRLDRRWRLTGGRVEGSLRRLHGLGVPVNEASARVELEGGRSTFDIRTSQDERHRVHLAGQAVLDSGGTDVTLEKFDITADSTRWALSHPTRIESRPGKLSVHDFDLRSADGRVEAHGVIDRQGSQDFRLQMDNVGLGFVSALIGREDVSGVLNGGLALEGPAANPRGSGDFKIDFVVDDQPAGALRSNLAWNGANLDFTGRFETPKGDSLVWNGGLPLAMSLAATPDSSHAPAQMRVVEGDVDVRLAAKQFPLAGLSPLLDPRTVGTLAGTLDLDVRLRGSSRAIVGNGRVDVAGGVVPLPGLGVIYRDLELHGAFENDRLVVSRAHATSQKGTLDVSGDVRFVGMTRVEPRLHVDTKRFQFVDSPDVRAIASASVDLAGTLAGPVIKGKVSIENSSFYINPANLEGAEAEATVRLTDADRRMMEETFGYVKASTPDAALAFFDASDLDLAVTLARNNWVRQRSRPKMSVAFTGDFQLRKKPHAEPELFGKIEPVPNRGYVEQFARSFDITGGEVLLNGKAKDHRVDLQAQYKPPSSTESSESETVIQLDVKGPADKLKLSLSSEPPMSEVEIVNFIATGYNAADKSSPTNSDASTSLAKDIGLSQVTGFAEEAAQEAIGLDVLQVRFDALQGATLVAGRYIDSQLYVGFRQPLQYKDSNSPTSTETHRTSFELEYAVYRWLVWNFQGETSTLRSFIRASHAY